MKAADWIDRVKAKRQIDSDYGVAKLLGISRTTVSMHRTRTSTLDETTALSVALALGEKPEAVILDQLAERTKDVNVRSTLSKMARSLCILC